MRIENDLYTVCSYHVTYAFQSESTLHSCLNDKELLARNRHEIWILSDCNWTWTHNHLARKWLSVRLRAKWLWVWVQLQSLMFFTVCLHEKFLSNSQKSSFWFKKFTTGTSRKTKAVRKGKLKWGVAAPNQF